MDDRIDAFLNGALIVIGAAAIVDTILVHWVLGWHRLIEGMPDPELFAMEFGVVIVGTVLLFTGVYRE